MEEVGVEGAGLSRKGRSEGVESVWGRGLWKSGAVERADCEQSRSFLLHLYSWLE